jgi:hypothetical protein
LISESSVPPARFTLGLIAFLIFTPIGFGAELTRRAKGDLAIEARGILRKYCFECHQGDAPSHGRVSVTHHGKLVGKAGPIPFVSKDPKAPRSQVIEFLEDGSMPPGGRERPKPDEIAKVKAWVEAGAPSYPVGFDDETILKAIADDLDPQDENTRPHLRYLSLAHLVPEAGQSSKLAEVEGNLQKALLAASDGGMKKDPVPVDDTATLFRLDLRDLNWHHTQLFERIEQEKPFGVYSINLFDLILLDNPFAPPKPPTRFVRADWLAGALWYKDKPTPLANDLNTLIRLATSKGGEIPKGPNFRPFIEGKPVSAVVPPLASWSATDVTPDPPPFTFTAALTDMDQKPIKAIKLNAPFRILAECDREVRLTLLTVFDDGQVSLTPVARGNRVAAGKSKVIFQENPDGEQAFTIASISTDKTDPSRPKVRDEMTVHYVLFASEGEPKDPIIIRSRHTVNPIWRIIPAEQNSRTTVRKVLKLTVTR